MLDDLLVYVMSRYVKSNWNKHNIMGVMLYFVEC